MHHKTDFDKQFEKDKIVYIKQNKSLRIESYSEKTKTIKFYDFDTIDKAKTLTNSSLWTTEQDTRDTCKLSAGQYFWFDIINCDIFQENELLGKVIDIQRFADIDYLLIKTDKNLTDKNFSKTFLLPYDKDLLSCDIDNNKIITINAKQLLQNS